MHPGLPFCMNDERRHDVIGFQWFVENHLYLQPQRTVNKVST